MPKRFTDTEKWKDEWYLNLSNDYKIVWQYILDTCSPAGILKKNFKLLNFCCGVTLTEKEFFDKFEGRVIDCEEFYFIPKFLKFQYPKGVNSDKPAIISVRNELIDKQLFEIIKQSLGDDYLIIKDKDKDIDKDKDKRFIPPTLEECRFYFIEKGYTAELGEKAWHYYNEANWHDSLGKKIKNWKQKMIAVWMKEENKVKKDNLIILKD